MTCHIIISDFGSVLEKTTLYTVDTVFAGIHTRVRVPSLKIFRFRTFQLKFEAYLTFLDIYNLTEISCRTALLRFPIMTCVLTVRVLKLITKARNSMDQYFFFFFCLNSIFVFVDISLVSRRIQWNLFNFAFFRFILVERSFFLLISVHFYTFRWYICIFFSVLSYNCT